MAHDIGFYGYRHGEPHPKSQEPDDTIGYFFGYAQGIFYTAFNATHCDNGISGANRGVLRSADQAQHAVKVINDSGIPDTYPDPGRIQEILEKLEQYLDEYPNCYLLIHYS